MSKLIFNFATGEGLMDDLIINQEFTPCKWDPRLVVGLSQKRGGDKPFCFSLSENQCLTLAASLESYAARLTALRIERGEPNDPDPDDSDIFVRSAEQK